MTRAVLLAALAACSPGLADGRQEPPPTVRFERDMMARFHMHQNFDLVRAIERLLIRGKVEEARVFATAIAIAPNEPAHGPWAAQAIIVRNRAAAVARASDARDALRKVAALGAACGNCHGEHAVKLGIDREPRLPPDAPTLDARMVRHRWAADRLWEAVIGNADEPWREGLDVLAAAPLEEPADRKGLALQLQRQADQARRPSSGIVIDRATQYGEILVTCAGCHTTQPR